MAQPSNPDLQLVQKAVQGNRKAFTSLFNRYFQSVFNFALMLSRDPALAEDLTQEAFIRAHANLDSLGPPWNFRAWIFRLTRNYFIDLTRKDRGVDPLEEGVLVKSPGPGPERETMSRETADRVQSTLSRLSTQHREILVLRELNEFSYAEIGQILDLGDSNVKVSLHRARAAFQESYGIQLLLDDPEGECQEVAELLQAYHDDELLDQEQFVKDHLKHCPECQERRRLLIAQSVAFSAFIPVIPPKALAERILQQTANPLAGPSVQKSNWIKSLFGYGGGAAVLGVMAWLMFLIIFNTEKILPNFPRSGDLPGTPVVLAQAAPTEEAAVQPPLPPPAPSPSPTAEQNCSLFEDLDPTLVMLNIQADALKLPIYLRLDGGVPGGEAAGGNGETFLPYTATLGDIPAYKCDLQGYPDRLYCMFTLTPEMPGQEHLYSLFLKGCDAPLFSQAVMLPLPPLPPDSENQVVSCHAGLDAVECKTLGGDYKRVNDTSYLCFCPPK